MRLEVVGEIVSRSPPELRDEPFCAEADVLKAIREADPDEEIELIIDSLGGSLTAGIAIYRALKNHPGSVTAKVEGYAASAASIVMCAADQVEVYNSSLIMIHGVQVVGEQISAANIQKLAGDIESLDSAIADIYVSRTGNDVETIRDWMNPEKWMSGADAVKLGFADTIRPEQRKAPAMENRARLQAKANPLTKEEMENVMKSIEDIGKELANACNPDKKKCEDDAAEDPKKDQEAENKPKAEADEEKKPDAEDGGDAAEKEEESKDETSDDETSDDEEKKEKEKSKDNPFQNMADAVAKAIADENARIKALDEIADMVPKKMLNEAKYGKDKMTAQELSYKVMMESKKQGRNFLNAWSDDQKDSGVNEVNGDPAQDKLTAKADAQARTLSNAIKAVNEERGGK